MKIILERLWKLFFFARRRGDGLPKKTITETHKFFALNTAKCEEITERYLSQNFVALSARNISRQIV